MVAGLLRAIGEIIGIDPDAVAADQAWGEIEEIPFGGGRRKHVLRVDVERVKDGRKLVHESDVEIALRILDHLGCLRDLNRGRLVQPSRYDRTVNRRDNVEGPRILTGYDLFDCFEPMSLVARVDPFRRIADREIASRQQTRSLLEDRHAIFLRRAGIDRGLVDDDVALFQSFADRPRGTQQCGQVWSSCLIDRGRNRYDEEVCAGEFGGIGCEVQVRMGNVARLDLARAVAAGLEFGNACGVYVEADDRRAPSAEGDSDRQPDISETDNSELATVRHDLPLTAP